MLAAAGGADTYCLMTATVVLVSALTAYTLTHRKTQSNTVTCCSLTQSDLLTTDQLHRGSPAEAAFIVDPELQLGAAERATAEKTRLHANFLKELLQTGLQRCETKNHPETDRAVRKIPV